VSKDDFPLARALVDDDDVVADDVGDQERMLFLGHVGEQPRGEKRELRGQGRELGERGGLAVERRERLALARVLVEQIGRRVRARAADRPSAAAAAPSPRRSGDLHGGADVADGGRGPRRGRARLPVERGPRPRRWPGRAARGGARAATGCSGARCASVDALGGAAQPRSIATPPSVLTIHFVMNRSRCDSRADRLCPGVQPSKPARIAAWDRALRRHCAFTGSAARRSILRRATMVKERVTRSRDVTCARERERRDLEVALPQGKRSARAQVSP
jgi:hypothetical protein